MTLGALGATPTRGASAFLVREAAGVRLSPRTARHTSRPQPRAPAPRPPPLQPGGEGVAPFESDIVTFTPWLWPQEPQGEKCQLFLTRCPRLPPLCKNGGAEAVLTDNITLQ